MTIEMFANIKSAYHIFSSSAKMPSPNSCDGEFQLNWQQLINRPWNNSPLADKGEDDAFLTSLFLYIDVAW